MSLYSKGVQSSPIGIPSFAEPARNRVGQVIAGYRMVREGETSMYPRGLGTAFKKQSVGAVSEGSLGKFVDTVVGFAVDTAHVGLIILGLITVKKAITP